MSTRRTEHAGQPGDSLGRPGRLHLERAKDMDGGVDCTNRSSKSARQLMPNG